MPMTKRSVLSVILFSIITCGIYSLYWVYVTTRDLQLASGKVRFSAGLILVLSIFVAPAGFVLFALEANDDMNAIRAAKGLAPVDNSVLWVVLCLLIGIVGIAIIQNEINTVA